MSNRPAEIVRCGACGTELSPGLLCCPGCGRLIHAEHLKALAGEAEQAEEQDDVATALVAWRRALELLPTGARQKEVIAERIEELVRRAPAATLPPHPTPTHGKVRAGGLAGACALALAIWKFKFIALFLLTKAKFLLQ